MFDCKDIYIKDIRSVVLVTPPQNPPKRSYYGPRMGSFELVYFISSENITSFDGKIIHNKPGCLEFLPKLDYDVEYIVDRIVVGECIDIHFDTDFPLPTEAFGLNLSDNKNLKQMFTKMYSVWLSKKEGYYYKCMELFYGILGEIQKTRSSYLPNSKYDKIKPGIDYISEHCFDENFDYSEPSRLCGISYSYFKRLFIEKYNCNPNEYVNSRKLERACELLGTGYYTIGEIALAVGYSNVYYFSKVFKEKYGCPPSRYSFNKD